MASVRSTVENVKEIFSVTELTDDQVQKFIDTASLIVYRNLVEPFEEDSFGPELEEEELDEVELYLAAHLCALREPRAQQERFDVLSATYQGKTGLYLDATYYGQTAKILDRTGTLAKLGGTKKTKGIFQSL